MNYELIDLISKESSEYEMKSQSEDLWEFSSKGIGLKVEFLTNSLSVTYFDKSHKNEFHLEDTGRGKMLIVAPEGQIELKLKSASYLKQEGNLSFSYTLLANDEEKFSFLLKKKGN